MITLKEAFRLCKVDGREVIYLSDKPEEHGSWSQSWPMTGKQVKDRYDMRNTKVIAIEPHYCCCEFVGFKFVIREEGRR